MRASVSCYWRASSRNYRMARTSSRRPACHPGPALTALHHQTSGRHQYAPAARRRARDTDYHQCLGEQEWPLETLQSYRQFFPLPACCQLFFAGVALMENFDVKTRGTYRGPAPCSGHRSTWMTSEPPISSPLSAYRSHKYLWLVSRSRVPSRRSAYLAAPRPVDPPLR